MIPAQFDYVLAESAEHAVALLAENGDDAKVLAGGHSLLPMMKLRLAAPEVLIDITRAGLSGISADGDELVIGATTRHADLVSSDLIRPTLPCWPTPRRWSATRRSGTAARSAARSRTPTRPPTSRWHWSRSAARSNSAARTAPGCCSPTISSPATSRTSLEEGELLTAIRVPRRPDDPWGYQKFVRRANDWAIVGVAAAGGRVALANMGSTPIRATATEQALASGADPAQAAEYAAEGTSPAADIHADAEYRRHLARILTERALSGQRS